MKQRTKICKQALFCKKLSLLLVTFDLLLPGRLIRCRKTEQSFDENGGSCVLTPTTGNHHTIHNVR